VLGRALLVLLALAPCAALAGEPARTSLLVGGTGVVLPAPDGMVGMEIGGQEAERILGARHGGSKLLWMFIEPGDNARIRERQDPRMDRTASVHVDREDEPLAYSAAAFEDFKERRRRLVASPDYPGQLERSRQAWNDFVRKQPVREGEAWRSRSEPVEKFESLGWIGDGKGYFAHLQRNTSQAAGTPRVTVACRAYVLAAGKLLRVETVSVERDDRDRGWVRITCLGWLKDIAQLNPGR